MKTLRYITLTAAAVAAFSLAAQAEDVNKLLSDAQVAMLKGDVATAKSNFEMVHQLDPKNKTAIAGLARIAADQSSKGGGDGAIRERQLSTVMIPKIEFREASLRESLDFMKKKVSELTKGKEVLNFVLPPGEAVDSAKITLSLNNIPVTEALRYIGSQSGVTFTYEKFAIVAKLASTAGGPAPAAKEPTPQ